MLIGLWAMNCFWCWICFACVGESYVMLSAKIGTILLQVLLQIIRFCDWLQMWLQKQREGPRKRKETATRLPWNVKTTLIKCPVWKLLSLRVWEGGCSSKPPSHPANQWMKVAGVGVKKVRPRSFVEQRLPVFALLYPTCQLSGASSLNHSCRQ